MNKLKPGTVYVRRVLFSGDFQRLCCIFWPKQNGLAKALREIGRIERTLFMLDWFREPHFVGGYRRD